MACHGPISAGDDHGCNHYWYCVCTHISPKAAGADYRHLRFSSHSQAGWHIEVHVPNSRHQTNAGEWPTIKAATAAGTLSLLLLLLCCCNCLLP